MRWPLYKLSDWILLEHLTVIFSVPAASEVGSAFISIDSAERIANGLDQTLDRSRSDTA